MWQLHDFQISGSINKVVLVQSHAHLFTYCLWVIFATVVEFNTVIEIETTGPAKPPDIYYQVFNRNSLLILALSPWKVSGRLAGVFTVESVYDLIWLHLQTPYTLLLLNIIIYLVHKLMLKRKTKLISLKCLGPAKQSYIQKEYFFEKKTK